MAGNILIQKRTELVLLITLIILIVFPYFSRLGTYTLRTWDESRVALHSMEMLDNHKFLVPHFHGQPEDWHLKPPMTEWTQIISMKLFGYNNVAVRLPSAVAGFLSSIILFSLCTFWLKKPLMGFIAGLIPALSEGFCGYHVTRSADYDALLAFLILAYLASFFIYMTSESEKNKWIWLTGLFIVLGVWTKGIQALLPLPACAIMFFAFGQHKQAFKNKHFWFASVATLIGAVSYYLIREQLTPGYLKLVWENELGGRYGETLEEHDHPFWHYFNLMWDYKFTPWLFWIPFGMFSAAWFKDKTRKAILFFSAAAITYFLIISNSGTKLLWYDAPLFPMLALVVAAGIYLPAEFILKQKINPFLQAGTLFLYLFSIAFFPYYKAIERLPDGRETYYQELMYGDALEDFYKENPEKQPVTMVTKTYNTSADFYHMAAVREGKPVSIARMGEQLETGSWVLICVSEVEALVRKDHKLDSVAKYNGCPVFEVKGMISGEEKLQALLNNPALGDTADFEPHFNNLVSQIHADEQWLKEIEAKASGIGRTTEEQVYLDAIYVMQEVDHLINEIQASYLKAKYLRE